MSLVFFCRCGLVYCYKKLLDQLPRVGDDNLEESSAEFEVSGHNGCKIKHGSIRA